MHSNQFCINREYEKYSFKIKKVKSKSAFIISVYMHTFKFDLSLSVFFIPQLYELWRHQNVKVFCQIHLSNRVMSPFTNCEISV